MGRFKGSKNKASNHRPIISTLTPQERIQLLANLIIDKIFEDQRNGQALLKQLKQQ